MSELESTHTAQIASTTYRSLVAQYRTFAKKTAENIVRLAETLVEAKLELTEAELRQFCSEVGLEHEGSTFRKLLKIGNEASRFEPFFERMPNSWTTVYKLAKLEKDVFDHVARDHRFTPMMTASEVDAITARSSDKNSEQLSRDLTIDLHGFDRAKKVAVLQKIEGLVQEFGFVVKIGNDLVKEMRPAKSNSTLTLGEVLKSAA
jgi:hypothetical protein